MWTRRDSNPQPPGVFRTPKPGALSNYATGPYRLFHLLNVKTKINKYLSNRINCDLMELKVVKQGEKKLLLELNGETIAFAHLLKDELWKDGSISEAAAVKEHPYLSEPKVLAVTSRGSPKSALEKASERIVEQTKEFREKFKEALKK